MSEVDYVVPKLVVDQKNVVFEVKELYNSLRTWGDLNRYDFMEKEYTQQAEDDLKSTTIKWIFERRMDDYMMFVIKMKFTIKGKEVSMKKKGKSVQGDIKVKFEAYIKKDYDDKWERKPILKFIRGFQDHFISRGKILRFEDALKKECYDIYNETKSFFNLSVFH